MPVTVILGGSAHLRLWMRLAILAAEARAEKEQQQAATETRADIEGTSGLERRHADPGWDHVML